MAKRVAERGSSEEGAGSEAELAELMERAALLRRSSRDGARVARLDPRTLSAMRLAELAQRAFDEPGARVERVLRGVLGPPAWPGEPANLRLLSAKLDPRKPPLRALGPTALRARFDSVDRGALELLQGGSHGRPPMARCRSQRHCNARCCRLSRRTVACASPRTSSMTCGPSSSTLPEPGRSGSRCAAREGELVLDATLTRGAERLHAGDVALVLEGGLAVAGSRLIEVDWHWRVSLLRRARPRAAAALRRARPARPCCVARPLSALDLPLDAPAHVLEVGGTLRQSWCCQRRRQAGPGSRRASSSSTEESASDAVTPASLIRDGRLVRVRPDLERERAAEESSSPPAGVCAQSSAWASPAPCRAMACAPWSRR